MIRIVLVGFIIYSFSSCSVSDTRGEIVSRKSSRWASQTPGGMVKIPTGSFIMGNSSGPSVADEDAPIKTVSLMGFYMDDTEITNAEYKTFISWVRDKSLRIALADEVQELLDGMTEEEASAIFANSKKRSEPSIFEYAYLESDTSDLSEYKRFILDKISYDETAKKINWEPRLYYGNEENVKFPGKEYIEVMDQFMIYDTLTGDIKFNDKELVYTYEGSRKGDMADFPQEVKIYPDESVWTKDFEYAYNEPMQENYFTHLSYNDYPVVGVTWDQARAFCTFRTEEKNKYNKEKRLPQIPRFRLPNETEWEYAARGGIQGSSYPWGTPLLKDPKGCYLANFKPKRGNYVADGAMYTSPVKMYQPNGYGLYGMAGNVSEWTSTVYNESTYTLSSTMNPKAIKNQSDLGKRVVRGGSWKDVAYFLRVSVRDYEYKDKARSYIGFRVVRDFTSGTKY